MILLKYKYIERDDIIMLDLVNFKIFFKLKNYYNKTLKFEKDSNMVDRRLIMRIFFYK
jgi:hypothetical protein